MNAVHKPVTNVQVTLGGELLYISQVSTVGELQQKLKEESGLEPEEQGSVTYQGKLLDDPKASLRDAGLQDGGQINIIPKRHAEHHKMLCKMWEGLIALRQKQNEKDAMGLLGP